MCTYGANLGSLLALVDVAAVGALPYNLLALGKYFALLYVSQQLEVTSLMLLLDQTNLLEQESNLGEALFLSRLQPFFDERFVFATLTQLKKTSTAPYKKSADPSIPAGRGTHLPADLCL